MFRDATLALVLVLATVGASAQSQIAISGVCGDGCAQPRAVPSSGHTGLIGISGPIGGRGFRRPFPGNPYLSAWPYLSPGYYDYANFSDSYQPQIAQPAPTPAPAPPVAPQEKPETLPDPVLLELQGNQWVRVSSFKTTVSQPTGQTQPVQAKPMPPAVLIFRDGHREEISSYSIIGQVIYTKGDYWATGSWTRSIQISDLNLPATFKENQERGVGFNLPSGPDEVVIRP